MTSTPVTKSLIDRFGSTLASAARTRVQDAVWASAEIKTGALDLASSPSSFQTRQKLPTKHDSKLDAGKMPCRRTNRLFPGNFQALPVARLVRGPLRAKPDGYRRPSQCLHHALPGSWTRSRRNRTSACRMICRRICRRRGVLPFRANHFEVQLTISRY
jgi:hypothetical protein